MMQGSAQQLAQRLMLGGGMPLPPATRGLPLPLQLALAGATASCIEGVSRAQQEASLCTHGASISDIILQHGMLHSTHLWMPTCCNAVLDMSHSQIAGRLVDADEILSAPVLLCGNKRAVSISTTHPRPAHGSD